MSKIKALQEAPQCPLYQGMQMERVEKNDQKSQTGWIYRDELSDAEFT